MRGYCEKCKKIVNLNNVEYPSEFNVRGKTYKYMGVKSYCSNCKELVDDIPDIDLKRRDDIYREEEKIITIIEINEILLKYNIGKKPLSKLLGWGETTIIRYIDGDIPSKIYSDELKKILVNTSYMEKILEENKKNISDTAYKKVKNSIKKLNKNDNEIYIVASYIINKCSDITPLALQKILYYSQGFFYAFFNSELYSDECEAWVHGPVYRKIYDRYKDFKGNVIVEKAKYDFENELNEIKREYLDVIIKCFGYYSGNALEKMTHFEIPWLNARKDLLPNESSNKVIGNEEIKEYFTSIKNTRYMANIFDIRRYSSEMFEHVQME